MNIPESIFSALTEEHKKKVEAAKTPEELLAVAKETGSELSEEQLESVAGGKWCSSQCEHCSHGSCKEECTMYYPCGQFCFKY